MSDVRTRDEAIALVDASLETWATNVRAVVAQARATADAAKSQCEDIVRNRAAAVSAIEALLAAARDQERRQLQARLVIAQEALDAARRAAIRVGDVAEGLSHLDRAHVTASTQVARARAQLSTMSDALANYRNSGGSFASGGSHRQATVALHDGREALASLGLTEINVNAADLDENPILDDHRSQGTFGKGGLSRADYRWAVQTWHDVVGPGVANGKTREDFAALDTRSGAGPLRRRADVYDMFLGDDRIRVDRKSDGSLNIVNGRHRLFIAQELGVRSLPGQVAS